MDGLILIDKEAGMTSRDVSNSIGKLFKTKKVGHLGTLDPFAEGLLPVFIGKATKIIPYIDDSKKTYIATLKLGEETDTLDNTGKVIKTSSKVEVSDKEIEDAFITLLKSSTQKVPSYSAKHVNGKRLYEVARSGKETPSIEKDIKIYSLDLLKNEVPYISFRVTVSKGTYIRQIASDLATLLDSCAYLTSLKRESISNFDITQAKKLSQITEADIIPITEIDFGFSKVQISDELIKFVKNGNKIPTYLLSKTSFGKILFIDKDIPLALYQKEGNEYICLRGL